MLVFPFLYLPAVVALLLIQVLTETFFNLAVLTSSKQDNF